MIIASDGARTQWLRVVVWTVTLLGAGAAQIAFDLTGAVPPSWLSRSIVGMVAVALATSIVWQPLRPLARFFLVLLLLQPLMHSDLWPAPWWAWSVPLPAGQPPLRAEFVLELAVGATIIVVLLATGLSRRQVYLRAGELDAPAAPVRWLFDRPIPWSILAPLSAALIGLGTLAFTLLTGTPPALDSIAAILPAALLFAALNAFNEELAFRAGPMASLEGVVGSQERLLLVVAVFALPHYFGIPFGLIGVAMAGAFAWWTAKCLAETRGLLWPWFIHLIQDLVIFSLILPSS